MFRTSGYAGLLVLVVWSWAIQFIEFYGPRIPGQELSSEPLSFMVMSSILMILLRSVSCILQHWQVMNGRPQCEDLFCPIIGHYYAL